MLCVYCFDCMKQTFVVISDFKQIFMLILQYWLIISAIHEIYDHQPRPLSEKPSHAPELPLLFPHHIVSIYLILSALERERRAKNTICM